eukprot:COSAG01_NODE_7245_length_3285_cov_2.517891_2_plen_272_part_00
MCAPVSGSDLFSRFFDAAPGLAILVDGDILAPDTMLLLLNEFGAGQQLGAVRARYLVLSKLVLDPLFHVGNFVGLFVAQALLVGVLALVAPVVALGAGAIVAVLPCVAVCGAVRAARGALTRRDESCSQHFHFFGVLCGGLRHAAAVKLGLFGATVILQTTLSLGVACLLCCVYVRRGTADDSHHPSSNTTSTVWLGHTDADQGAPVLVGLNWAPSAVHVVSVLGYLTLSELFLHGLCFHPYAGRLGKVLWHVRKFSPSDSIGWQRTHITL